MRRLAVVVAAVVVFGGFGTAGSSAQTTDAVSVARALIDAENAHNVTAAVNSFAPGAIVVLPTGVFVGAAEITGWQRELAAGNFRAEITTPVAVTPEVVSFTGTVALDSFRALGISPLAATWDLTIQQGRVTTFRFDFTPAATARLLAALGGAGAAPPAAAGSSGGGSGSSTTPATATAGRTLALTGMDLGLAAAGGLAVLVGMLMLGLARREPSARSVHSAS